jgi:hypothetical protein
MDVLARKNNALFCWSIEDSQTCLAVRHPQALLQKLFSAYGLFSYPCLWLIELQS